MSNRCRVGGWFTSGLRAAFVGALTSACQADDEPSLITGPAGEVTLAVAQNGDSTEALFYYHIEERVELEPDPSRLVAVSLEGFGQLREAVENAAADLDLEAVEELRIGGRARRPMSATGN